MFDQVPLFEDQKLQAEMTDWGRQYTTPVGNKYPSVTTVLGVNSEEGIQQWRDAIGAERADKITNLAASKGTRLHEMVEHYLLNKPLSEFFADPITAHRFKKIKSFLDNNVELIYNIESALYSDILKVAGRIDLLCLIKNKICLVDFKTSKKKKYKKWVHNYFLQGAAYCFMLKEQHSININNTIIIISVEDTDELQIFSVNPKDYIDDFVTTRNKFKKRYSI